MQFQEAKLAVEEARRRFTELQKNHRPFLGYLVFSTRFGQAQLDSSLRDLLLTLPQVFADSREASEAHAVARRLKVIDHLLDEARKKPDLNASLKAEQATLEQRLKELEPSLLVNDLVQVEIRFGHPADSIVQNSKLSSAERGNLDYALIAELQQDELVDRNLTPQTRASIRIVLGTLRSMLRAVSPRALPG